MRSGSCGRKQGAEEGRGGVTGMEEEGTENLKLALEG